MVGLDGHSTFVFVKLNLYLIWFDAYLVFFDYFVVYEVANSFGKHLLKAILMMIETPEVNNDRHHFIVELLKYLYEVFMECDWRNEGRVILVLLITMVARAGWGWRSLTKVGKTITQSIHQT